MQNQRKVQTSKTVDEKLHARHSMVGQIPESMRVHMPPQSIVQRQLTSPNSLTKAGLFFLQRNVGNNALKYLHKQISISQSNSDDPLNYSRYITTSLDPKIASSPIVQRRCACGNLTGAGEECKECQQHHADAQLQTNKEYMVIQPQMITPLGQGGGFGGLMDRDRRRVNSLAEPVNQSSRAYPFSVTTSGCNKKPYERATIIAAAREAFDKVLSTNCIKSQSLKNEILDEFDGLNIDCEQDKDGPCGMASRYFTQTVNLYPKALNLAKCGPLASTILHEIVHLTEWRLFGHGDLTDACEKSCFGYGSGDSSKCK